MIKSKDKHSTHFLSVDLEDWYTSAYLRNYVKENECVPRIANNSNKILALFDKHGVKATFFVLGSIAEKNPGLIKKIAEKGHEIASHGYSHTPLWDLDEASFENEIILTNQILKAITKKDVFGFRAPYASLTQQNSWAIDVLQRNGFRYDSSVFPMQTPLYGLQHAPLQSYRISSKNIVLDDPNSPLLEIPFSIYQKFGIKIPCTGGIYGRFLPKFILKELLKNIAKDRALNFYFHPWEIDRDIPKIKVPPYNHMVTYYNIDGYLKKIDALLNYFPFSSFENKLNLK